MNEDKPLTKEEREFVEIQAEASFSSGQFSEQRSSELADEYTRLAVQLAGLILAFSVIFLQEFNDKLDGVTGSTVFLLKSIYAVSVFSLVASLALGLIHIVRKEKFWNEWLLIRMSRWRKWKEVLEKNSGLREAKAYHEGTSLEKEAVVHSPKWTWILQTVCLGIAIGLFMIIFLVFLFGTF
jgi:hypothetical protein